MIEKIDKYLFLVYHQDYDSFLLKLRDLGVVHIKENKPTSESEQIKEIVVARRHLSDLIRTLSRKRSEEQPIGAPRKPASTEEGEALLQQIETLLEDRRQIASQIESQQRENDYWEPWGDYDVQQLERLQQAGYPVRFYIIPTAQYQEHWEEEHNAIIIDTRRSHHYFITVGDKSTERIEAEQIKAPTHTASELAERLASFEQRAEQIDTEIQEFIDQHLEDLQGYDLLLQDKYQMSNAFLQATGEADDKVMLLEGWIPNKIVPEVRQELDQLPCYYAEQEILDEDKIPIKLQNNRFSRLFEPITRMYSLPNYSELDSTPLFAPFFMLFFSLCFGDAGYGLVIFLLATLFKRKVKGQSTKDICSLAQWLGGTTVVVGSLLGTVFGMVMPWANDGSVLGSVRNDYFLNQDNLMLLSVVLGIIQILFAKTVAAVKIQKQRGIKYALSSYAWVIVIFALIMAVALPMAATGIPSYVTNIFYGLAIAAGLVVVFYNSPGKNIFLNIGSSLWASYNTASGLLGDTLSYIRLFAIGLTSGVLGGVFNNLAVSMSEGLPIGLNWLVMVFILLFGHGLNFGLAIISSLVHPLRLTFVEYYKNSEFEGGGKPYTPFKVN